ncbi:MAG: hypothetical protein WC752_02580 [Patescibacteria group bacterium]|jgi:hypothetical protein
MSKKIISHFNEKPKTKICWISMILGLISISSGPILGISAAVLMPFLSSMNENIAGTIGIVSVIMVFVMTIVALVVAILAYRKGERSWAMWVGLVPAVLGAAFWVFMLVGEFLFPH